jgi:Protein of unknown function (DUF3309)
MRGCACKKFQLPDPALALSLSEHQLRGLGAGARSRVGRTKKSLAGNSPTPYTSAMRNILLIVLILLLIGAFPSWGYSSGWGYYPFGGIGLVLLIVLILALMGRL